MRFATVRLFHAGCVAVPTAAVLGYWAALGLQHNDAQWFANATIPAMQGAALLALAILFVKANPAHVWSPIPWFLAACAVYFGFGPLVYCFGNQESIDYADAFYDVNQLGLLKTNLLSSVGILAVVIGLFASSLFLKRQNSTSVTRDSQLIYARRVAWLFLTVGVPINVFITFPSKIGLLSWTPPGIVAYLASLVGLAIIPLWWLTHETREAKFRWILFVVIASELLLGIATLSKLEILKTVLLVGLARYLCRPKLRDLVVGGLIVLAVYVVILSPFVTYARILLGSHSAQSADEVAAAVGGFSADGKADLADLLPGVQGWWTRFSYSNAQLFAIDSYDRGMRGTTFETAFYVVVPRFLYPDKPLLSPGREFTWLVTGNALTESFTSPGAFAEGYWNGGWLGLLFVGALMGVFIGLYHQANAKFISQKRFLYLPFMFLGLLIASRPDDWFLLAYLGGGVQAFALLGILLILEPYVRGMSKVRSMPAAGNAVR